MKNRVDSYKKHVRSYDEYQTKRRRILRTPCDNCMNDRYKCCICMDKRSFNFLYEAYVDGVGICKTIKRS